MGDAFTHLAQRWVAERTRRASLQYGSSPTSAPAPPPPYSQQMETKILITSEPVPAEEAEDEANDSDSNFDSEDNDPEPFHHNHQNHRQQCATEERNHPKSSKERTSPLKITINAANSIQGSNNLVPTSATPLADAAKFSQLLMFSINQIQTAVQNQSHQQSQHLSQPRNSWDNSRSRGTTAPSWDGTIDLTINCGITIVGDRNVVGHVGVKPRSTFSPAGSEGESGSDGVASGSGSRRGSLSPDAAAAAVVAGAKRKADEDGVGELQKPMKKVSFKEEVMGL